jgi:hypothetical protein
MMNALHKLEGRTVEIDFGTRSGVVTLANLKEWKGGDHHRVYFTLSNSVKDFPTKGYIDLSGNARINPMQITVRVGDFSIVIEDGYASSKRKKAEIIRAITVLFTLPEEPVEVEEQREDAPETILWVSDERVELGRRWEGYAFRNVEAFRAAMEAAGLDREAEEVLEEWELLKRGEKPADWPSGLPFDLCVEELTFTGDFWNGERRFGEVLTGPVYRSSIGLHVLPYTPELFPGGVSHDITCIKSFTPPYRDFM